MIVEYFVKINKKIEVISGELESVRLTLVVAETSGVTSSIFVHRYFPKSPYSGSEEYEFYNVAYPDELTSISDKLTNKHSACYIRTPKVVKIFKNMSDMEDFVSTIMSDLSRLLRHLKTFDIVGDSLESQITVTGSGHTEKVVSDAVEDNRAYKDIDNSNEAATALETELNNIKTETIIVDITGK